MQNCTKIQDQIVNRRNDRLLCKFSQFSRIMHNKFPATVIILGVVRNVGHVMPLHFFPQRIRVKSSAYIKVLETVIRP